MKRILSLVVFTASMFTTTVFAQDADKSKRPSPPATVTETVPSGAVVTINYNQPSVKGRVIGKDLEPKEGIVWRTGANEATVFETTKDVKVNGQLLPAGKYAFFTISGKNEWTLLFNKTWNQWGAYDYKAADDVLKVSAKANKSAAFSEKLTFKIDKNGDANLFWGDIQVSFQIM